MGKLILECSQANFIVRHVFNITMSSCPPGMIYNAAKQTCQMCKEGTYQEGQICKRCPTGAYCSGGTHMTARAGYWRKTKSQGASFIRCAPVRGSVAEACRGWSDGTIEGEHHAVNESCRPGHAEDSPLCAICRHSHSKSTIGLCEACPNHAGLVLRMALVMVGIIAVAIGAVAAIVYERHHIEKRFEVQQRIALTRLRWKFKRERKEHEHEHEGDAHYENHQLDLYKKAVKYAYEARKGRGGPSQNIAHMAHDDHHRAVVNDLVMLENERHEARSSLKKLESVLKIMIGFYQVFLAIAQTFNFDFPPLFLEWKERFSFVQLELYRWAGLTCLIESDYIHELLFTTLIPL